MDDGGSPITGYKVFVDAGDNFSSSFTEVASYNGEDAVFTTHPSLDNLVQGKVYRFKTKATNVYGDSEFSNEVIIGIGENVPAPADVTRDSDFQSETSILVHWTAVTSSDLPITGYTLQMDDGLIGPFTEIYDGRDNV
jgi:hypothetical protein